MADKIGVRKVKIIPLPQLDGGELSEVVHRHCEFCQKEVEVYNGQRDTFERLSGAGRFFCTFCLRNGLYAKSNRHVLVMSYRSIIGFLYHELYVPPIRKLYLAELEDMIQEHARVGLSNPCFRYDPETFLWFVDFGRVGQTPRKLRIEDVLRTTIDTLACFNLWETVPGLQLHAFYGKYKEALTSFYAKRYRPEGRKMLIPTFTNCGHIGTIKPGILEKTRDFTRKHLVMK